MYGVNIRFWPTLFAHEYVVGAMWGGREQRAWDTTDHACKGISQHVGLLSWLASLTSTLVIRHT